MIFIAAIIIWHLSTISGHLYRPLPIPPGYVVFDEKRKDEFQPLAEYDRVEHLMLDTYGTTELFRSTGNSSLIEHYFQINMDRRNCALHDCHKCVVRKKLEIVHEDSDSGEMNRTVSLPYKLYHIDAVSIFPGKTDGYLAWYDCQATDGTSTQCNCEDPNACNGTKEYCEKNFCNSESPTCHCTVRRNDKNFYMKSGKKLFKRMEFMVWYYICAGRYYPDIVQHPEENHLSEDLQMNVRIKRSPRNYFGDSHYGSAYGASSPQASSAFHRIDPTVLNASQTDIKVNLNPQNLPATMILRKSGLEEKIIIETSAFTMKIPMELQLEGGLLYITLIVPDGHVYKIEVYLQELEFCEKIQCVFCMKMIQNIHCLPDTIQYGFYVSLIVLTLIMVYYIKMALIAIYFIGTVIYQALRGIRFIIRSVMGKGVRTADKFSQRCTSFMAIKKKPTKTPDTELGDIRTMIREQLEELDARSTGYGAQSTEYEPRQRRPASCNFPYGQEIYGHPTDFYDVREPYYNQPEPVYAVINKKRKTPSPQPRQSLSPLQVTVLVIMLLIPIVLPCNDHKIMQSKVEHCEKTADGENCKMKLNVGVTLKNLGAKSCLWLTDENANPVTRIELEFEKVTCVYSTEIQYFTAPTTLDSMLTVHCSQNEYCGWGHNCVGGARFQEKDSDRVVDGEEIYYSPLFSKDSTQYPGRTECQGHVVGTPMCGIKHYSPCLFYRYWFIPEYERIYKVSKITGRQCESTIVVTEGLADSNQTTYRISGQKNLITDTGIEIDLQGTYAQGDSYFKEALVTRVGNVTEGYLIEASPPSQPRSQSIGDVQSATQSMKTFIFDQTMVSCKFYHEQMRCRKPDSVITNMFTERKNALPLRHDKHEMSLSFNGKLISEPLESAPMNLLLSADEYSVFVKTVVVCPKIEKQISITGCYSCSSLAVLKIQAKSTCMPGVVSVAFKDITISTRMVKLETSSTEIIITFQTDKQTHSERLCLSHKEIEDCIALSFTLDAPSITLTSSSSGKSYTGQTVDDDFSKTIGGFVSDTLKALSTPIYTILGIIGAIYILSFVYAMVKHTRVAKDEYYYDYEYKPSMTQHHETSDTQSVHSQSVHSQSVRSEDTNNHKDN